MHILEFSINKQIITWTNPCRVPVEGTEGFLFARFETDDEWYTMNRTAIFQNGFNRPVEVPVTEELTPVPPEVIKRGQLFVGLVGRDSAGEIKLTTQKMWKGVPLSAATESFGKVPDNIVPEAWEKALASIGNLSDLNTEAKNNLVAAINEVFSTGAGSGGSEGTDGREVEMSVVNGYIVWRYVGETAWKNLIALSDLKGDPGRGVKSIAGNADGSWTITYTDNAIENVSSAAYAALKATVDKAVLTDAMSLTAAQQAQARENIGAAASSGWGADKYLGTDDTGKVVEKVAPAAVTAETDPTVYEWAKRELFDKADLPLGMQSFVTVDGVEYYRYHAGATSFTWNNPRPLSGAVTITTRGVAQHGGTGSTRLRTFYDDGTEGPDLTIIQSGESKTVTVTTDASKTLAKITGNYDMENWVLLDMSVMSVIANYDAGLPAASADFCGGIKADKAESTDTQPVRIGADGKLYTAPGGSGSGGGSYTLPIAAAETLGGVKPVSKTEDMTQSVGVDETGGLWTATAKASGSAEKKWRLINSVTVEDYVENEDGTNNKVMKVWFSKDLNGNSIALDEIVVEIISNSTFVGSYNWLCLYETAGSTLNETKQWLREGASNTIRTVEVGPITNDGKRLLRTYSFSQYMDFAPIFNGGFDAGGYGKMKFSGPIKEVCYGGFNKVNGLTINLYGLDAVGE